MSYVVFFKILISSFVAKLQAQCRVMSRFELCGYGLKHLYGCRSYRISKDIPKMRCTKVLHTASVFRTSLSWSEPFRCCLSLAFTSWLTSSNSYCFNFDERYAHTVNCWLPFFVGKLVAHLEQMSLNGFPSLAQHAPELMQVLRDPIATIWGRAGTGKTRTCTELLMMRLAEFATIEKQQNKSNGQARCFLFAVCLAEWLGEPSNEFDHWWQAWGWVFHQINSSEGFGTWWSIYISIYYFYFLFLYKSIDIYI